MYKVIISDDEKKVCQLIHMLIDWAQLEMEIVATAHNGIEVLDMVKEHSPDLIITDIRMPGLGGLEMIQQVKKIDVNIEFIIISGYRHFEYAQTAIKYGVNDYLLKPIKKDELTITLTKMKEKFLEKSEAMSQEELMRKNLENNIIKLRKGLFTELLFMRIPNKNDITMEKVNQEYHYNFEEGYFQVVCIKFDHVRSVLQGSISVLTEKTYHLVKHTFASHCYDLGMYFDNNAVFVVLNYSPEDNKLIRRQLKTMLTEHILQDVMYQNLNITIGVGDEVEQIPLIYESYKKSNYAVQQRLLNGSKKILQFEPKTCLNLSDSPIFYGFNRTFTTNLDNLDVGEIIIDLDSLKRNLMNRTETTGHEILQMTKEVCNLYILHMRINKLNIPHSDRFILDFNEASNDCSSVHELFLLLSKTITDSMMRVIEDKKQADTKPIRMAKQYIEQNYMKSISLDQVSTQVGFNVTYFSTLFKRETGSTFLEYLSNTRMSHAKTLLKETNYNIVNICEEVGYSDVKYFTKSFKKHTGLNPNEFRKLYS